MPFALTSLGNIKGRGTKTKTNCPYFAFYKIPFAKPPIGKLRFALPEPAESWKGEINIQTDKQTKMNRHTDEQTHR